MGKHIDDGLSGTILDLVIEVLLWCTYVIRLGRLSPIGLHAMERLFSAQFGDPKVSGRIYVDTHPL